jgi:hypothetical protein
MFDLLPIINYLGIRKGKLDEDIFMNERYIEELEAGRIEFTFREAQLKQRIDYLQKRLAKLSHGNTSYFNFVYML